jgi:hypothetical protein
MRHALRVLGLLAVLGTTLAAPTLAAVYECWCNGDFLGYVTSISQCERLCGG